MPRVEGGGGCKLNDSGCKLDDGDNGGHCRWREGESNGSSKLRTADDAIGVKMLAVASS